MTEAENIVQSDFYSYRYFASEGFLPGYSFPRLPLSAYIPARRIRSQDDEFLSRPRFLAISEFGPRSIIYHEGSRYIINKVNLPVSDTGEGFAVLRAKQCPICGYLHPIANGDGLDRCERCGSLLESPMNNLFRLQNVSTNEAIVSPQMKKNAYVKGTNYEQPFALPIMAVSSQPVMQKSISKAN